MLTQKTTPIPEFALIVAVAENGVIGKDNQLIWRLSDDLKNFKRLTTGHIILMGRKTYDSIGKPLPNRVNIIISSNKSLEIPGCEVTHSMDEAFALAARLQATGQKLFVIGGGQLYEQTLPLATTIYYTKVAARPAGDTFFPELPHDVWEIHERTFFEANEKNEYDFEIITYARKPTNGKEVSDKSKT